VQLHLDNVYNREDQPVQQLLERWLLERREQLLTHSGPRAGRC
jgi:hypothetical protein